MNTAATVDGTGNFSSEQKAPCPVAASALVPFSFHNPFHNALQDATRWFPIAGKAIRIDQAWQSDGRGGTTLGYGASVYDAAIALSLYLVDHPDLVKGNRIIELGCGPGLVGVVAAHLEPKSVVITDGDSASVALTQHNVHLNNLSADICTVEKYIWGDLEHHLVSMHAPYDVIIGADIVACPYASAFKELMRTLQKMAGPKTLVLLAYKRRQNSEEKFFKNLETAFDVKQVDRSQLHQDFQNAEIVIFQAHLKHKEGRS
ncbi:Predicted methyltransferase [Plasmopara halstedii]|uniref:Predicted methyltransferase n=1 Tax=Plasmopara halstedii TaxID=4781 RepID=A0A0N7L683_PLAHL|nr:Predicted methyltransferase [Plasmopara halstedii]CEG43555.1 Predicted methyltransferase [Plasmopara halstedii]|eukprot:XP_024579924.1 Predicted methyltransferase [Plasmopara halstedii]